MTGMSSGRQAAAAIGGVKQHLSQLAEKAGSFSDMVSATRYVMGNYSETGANRVLDCRVQQVAFEGFSGEWVVPADADEGLRGVYIHGGGWIAGSPDTHRHLVHMLAAATRRPILLIDYRLAPEHRFPQGLNDCVEAFEYVLKHGPSGAGNARNVALFGDSAGGNLVAAVAADMIMRGGTVPSALVMMSPALDFRPYPEPSEGIDDGICSEAGFTALADLYLQGDATIHDPRVSPLAAPDDILARFPPSLLQTTSIEYLRDQSVKFAARLWANGVSAYLSVQPDLPHAFHLFPQELANTRFAIAEIAHFLEVSDQN